MGELVGYRCPNCGAMLKRSRGNIYKCDFCDSEYEKEGEEYKPIIVPIVKANTIKLQSCIRVDEEAMRHDPKMFMEYTLKEMAHDMAEKMMPLLKMRVERDIRYCSYNVIGMIEVVDRPDKGFEIWDGGRP